MVVDQDYDDSHDPLDDGRFGPGEDFDPQDGPDLFGEAPSEGPESAPVAVVPEPPVTQDAPAAPKKQASAPRARRPEAPPAPLALYRRYRPDTFAEVIGQEHVTVPLQRALDNNRVNHAYLFSGPRGCGKTTSARILARCLNCEQGPTSTPCGQCNSCKDLATGGPGSIDVIEIDAASHGGVDDARDLRERAFFAPVDSRYKIYIVDEAHMVTPAGFNALLKLVEEPPAHAKFVFATTEPEKVISTIRSRTHHYPFRLVPPRVLGDYLQQICEQEGVVVEQSTLPLVVRAGGGSVRDSLSVLDQLLGGSGPDGVTYAQATALLGYTPDSLLDDIMDAFAAGDSAGVFSTIDRVMDVGQDPRRFAEDLLHRLRDLVILAAVPEAVESGMLDVPSDQAQRLATQVAGMGQGELARAAEVIAAGLTDMRGTTAPRLHLELMCARVLLPGADVDERGLHARMDRLERRVGMIGERPAAEPGAPKAPAPGAERGEAPVEPSAPVQASPAAAPTPSRETASSPAGHRPIPAGTEQAPASAPAAAAPRQRPAGSPPAPAAGQRPPAEEPREQPKPKATRSASSMDATELRRIWPDVLEEVKRRRRFTWMLLSQHAQVLEVADGVLRLGFPNPGARESFGTSGSQDILADSLIEVVGMEFRIQATASDDAGTAQPEPRQQSRPEPAANAQPAEPAPTRPQPSPNAGLQENSGAGEVAEDDARLGDADATAAGLLTEAFGAEIIGVEETGN